MSTEQSAYVILLHSPMVNRNGVEVTTAVTNLDIHDIARSCKTYGITRYYIVNPEIEQERLVARILGHWDEEVSKLHHPARAKALESVRYRRTFEEVFNEISLESKGVRPFVVMPDAKELPEAWSYEKLRQELSKIPGPLVFVFGTGWGISPSFYRHVDRPLKPIRSKGGHKYNHLSVRAAAAIVLDRVFGERD